MKTLRRFTAKPPSKTPDPNVVSGEIRPWPSSVRFAVVKWKRVPGIRAMFAGLVSAAPQRRTVNCLSFFNPAQRAFMRPATWDHEKSTPATNATSTASNVGRTRPILGALWSKQFEVTFLAKRTSRMSRNQVATTSRCCALYAQAANQLGFRDGGSCVLSTDSKRLWG